MAKVFVFCFFFTSYLSCGSQEYFCFPLTQNQPITAKACCELTSQSLPRHWNNPDHIIGIHPVAQQLAPALSVPLRAEASCAHPFSSLVLQWAGEGLNRKWWLTLLSSHKRAKFSLVMSKQSLELVWDSCNINIRWGEYMCSYFFIYTTHRHTDEVWSKWKNCSIVFWVYDLKTI